MKKLKEDVRQDIKDKLKNEVGLHDYGADLHHHLCNTDYFIIGTWKAKEWLGEKVFDAIEIIREYEEFNFGKVNTDFSDPEKVVNMVAYILGSEILSESSRLDLKWDECLSKEDLQIISEEI